MRSAKGEDGTLILGVRAPPKARNAHYHAPGVFTPERLGQWTHLAVVYDRVASQVTHYVDGHAVVEEPLLPLPPTKVPRLVENSTF